MHRQWQNLIPEASAAAVEMTPTAVIVKRTELNAGVGVGPTRDRPATAARKPRPSAAKSQANLERMKRPKST
jgi:hypothetical protein